MELTRRNFVAAGTAAAAGMAVTANVALADEAEAEGAEADAPVEEASPDASPESCWPDNGAILGTTPDWLGVEPEIAEDEIAETIDCDILVVGCGTGGMFAVAAAAEAGANVIGIDRFPTGVGIRDDLGAVNTRYQQEWGTQIDKFEFITWATQYAAGHINQKLVSMWFDESGEALDWYGDRLADRGVELWHEAGDDDENNRYKHYATGHSPCWAGSDDGDGNELDGNKVLYDYAVEQGARFDYSTQMVKLVKEDGRVAGCIATNPDGAYVRYNAAKGVVVCTGGYSLNYDMMDAMQPWNLRIIGRNGSEPGAFGDGIKACLWAGAKMDETHSMMMFDRCALRPDQETGRATAESGDNGWFWIGSQPWLKVNADGKRFFNESGTYEGILHADEYQKGHCHYTIFDSNWFTYVEQFEMHGCSRQVPFVNGADVDIPREVNQEVFLPQLLEGGQLIQADTLEELAEGLGLPVDAFVAEVEHYNEMCAAGEDADFGKEPHRLTPVDTAPFYGCKNTGYVLCTLDGIQIDTNMNALDTEGNPIEGLYVVGNDSGGYFANTYPNLATGMACGRTVTFGRHVGKYLAGL